MKPSRVKTSVLDVNISGATRDVQSDHVQVVDQARIKHDKPSPTQEEVVRTVMESERQNGEDKGDEIRKRLRKEC